MSVASSLDIRLPIGGLFTVLGLMLAGYGLATADEPLHYLRSFSVNINLWWGLVMLAFGVGLFLSATFYGRGPSGDPAADTTEGRSTEEREHRLGLERSDGIGE